MEHRDRDRRQEGLHEHLPWAVEYHDRDRGHRLRAGDEGA